MKSDRGKLIIYGFLGLLIFSVSSFLFTFKEYATYKTNVNEYIYGLLDTLKEKYPSITEHEVLSLLNGKNKKKYPTSLRKYGITEDSSLLYALEINYHRFSILHLLFIGTIFFIFVCFFLFYFKKKEKVIREITTYMKEINRRNYTLAIEDNKEGELSILKNEVYKTTLMLREESERLKKEKGALKESISDISHQLKTPLTSISIMLDNILENPNMEEKTKVEFIENVRHQVENIHFLLVSLLKLSRIETGVVEFKKEKISFEKIVSSAIKNVDILKEVRRVKLDVAIEENAYFLGDFQWELEAITNILKNAIEHSYEDGKIKVKVEKNMVYTKLMITDFGSGMTKEDLRNIFKRFYKGENSSQDSIGIGLNLAKNIIEKDGGLIEVYSELGKGTTFIIKYML